MKTKKTMARSTKSLFVLLAAVAVLTAFAVPASADNVGKTDNLMYHMSDIHLAGSQDAVLVGHAAEVVEALQEAEANAESESRTFPDAGGDGVVAPDEFEQTFPDAGGDGVPGPDEFEQTFPDAGGDGVAPPSDEESQTPPSQEESETPPSQEDSDTPDSDNGTETVTYDDEPTLPFTGGNATPFAIAGLLIALAGAVVFIYKRRVFGR